MAINPAGELDVSPKGSAPKSLSKGIQVTARNERVMVFSGININEPKNGESKDQEDDSDDSKQPWRLDPEELKRLQVITAKQYPDALKSDPEMARLLEQKHVVKQELGALLKTPGVKEEEVQPVLEKLEKLDEDLETAQRELNERGFVAKSLGSEYGGEDKKMGWRAGKRPEPPDVSTMSEDQKALALQEYAERLERWEEVESSKQVTTKYYAEQERERSKLHIDDEGVVHDSEGERMNGEYGMVMDTQGQSYQFKENTSETTKTKTDGYGNVISEGGDEKITHHSSILAGKEVAGAGVIQFQNGKIVSISNASGHYKPGTVQLIQTVEELVKQGAFLDKSWRMIDAEDGEAVTLKGKARELHEKSMKVRETVDDHAARARKLQDKIDGWIKDLEEFLTKDEKRKEKGKEPAYEDDIKETREDLDRALTEKIALDQEMQKGLDTLKKATEILRRLGAGPCNKLKGDVEHMHVTQDMTGEQIKVTGVQTDTVPVQDFLDSGGNEEQYQKKQTMQEELEEKLEGRRRNLDLFAEKRAKDVAAYFRKIENDTLPKLKEQLVELVGTDQEEVLKKRIADYESRLRSLSTPTKEEMKIVIKDLVAIDEELKEARARRKREKEALV